MNSWQRSALVFIALVALTVPASAQSGWPEDDANQSSPMPAPATTPPPKPTMASDFDTVPVDQDDGKPKRGDFDAGGRVRFPSGPDEMGEYATFNWVAVDLTGRYFVLDFLSIDGNIPLAIIKPDSFGGAEPSVFGGMTLGLSANLPKMPFAPDAYKTDAGLILTGGYMREGAMLLSDKDFPVFIGDFKPGFEAGVTAKVQLSSLIDVATAPVFIYQTGTDEAANAIQIPLSAIVKLGSVLKVSADAGFFSGDDFSFKGDGGGRIALGGALDVKIGPIVTHAGIGAASLLTGGLYPSIGDSLYIDVNIKYAK
ncbi:MAG TPA: hypothetical protein VFG83_08045 [Kofleriaceae bacterium]|nr:hypothetical protein [Kofleriaceae bacterium]